LAVTSLEGGCNPLGHSSKEERQVWEGRKTTHGMTIIETGETKKVWKRLQGNQTSMAVRPSDEQVLSQSTSDKGRG